MIQPNKDQRLKTTLFTNHQIIIRQLLLLIFLFSFSQEMFAQEKVTGTVTGRMQNL